MVWGRGEPGVVARLCILFVVTMACLAGMMQPSAAQATLTRTYTAQIGYPADPDRATYVANARHAIDELAAFFETVTFKQAVNYSLLQTVLHSKLTGFVATPDGIGAGLCAAATLLDSIVRNAVYRDSDSIERPVFQSLGTQPATNTFGGLCSLATTLDPKNRHSIDYLWRLNPNYTGAPPHFVLTALDGGASLTLTYSDRLASPAFEASPAGNAAHLADQFASIIGARKVGAWIEPISALHGLDPIGYHGDDQLPVASAFKGPVALYFFEHIDPVTWRSLPLTYWNVDQIDAVPDAYHDAWTRNHAVLKNLYQMAVFSENDATGGTLAYVYANSPTAAAYGSNPLIAFNTWSEQKVGIGAESGLHAWVARGTACAACTDERFTDRRLIYGGKVLTINNTYSPRDLARFYRYLAVQGRALGYYDMAIALLSNQHFSLIKENSLIFGITTASKDGYIGPDSDYGDGYRISTDAGLITLPDGEQYAVAFMAFDGGDLLPPSIQAMSHAVIEQQRADF